MSLVYTFSIEETEHTALATMHCPRGRVVTKRFRHGLCDPVTSALDWVASEIKKIRHFEEMELKEPSKIVVVPVVKKKVKKARKTH